MQSTNFYKGGKLNTKYLIKKETNEEACDQYSYECVINPNDTIYSIIEEMKKTDELFSRQIYEAYKQILR